MADTLPIRLAKLAQAEFDDGFDVTWESLTSDEQERWQRAALKVYQVGVADALKDPGAA